MFVTTAIAPATSLVSAQIRPTRIPTTSTATIAASQYRIRRLVMIPSLLSWGRFANSHAKPSRVLRGTLGQVPYDPRDDASAGADETTCKLVREATRA
jgi:hypothetical protein